VHFTREPIIESIITARDGYKLTVRNSKGNESEEYIVEAVEIISFGNALFFRSLEKPKAFLLPVTDYEVLETKETRVLLKSVSLEKSIKIGGGREAPMRITKEVPAEKEVSEGVAPTEEEEARGAPQDQRVDKRRDRRRHRRRRSNEERSEMKEWSEKKPTEETASLAALGGDAVVDETISAVSSPLFGTLIPPPTTLISETLARYKDTLLMENPLPSAKVNEPPKHQPSEFEETEEQARIVPHVHHISSEDDLTSS
jgi:hypothetical protein